MSTAINKENGKTSNKDYGSYTFKGKKYDFCVAKKLEDINGGTIIAVPIEIRGNCLYYVSYDVAEYNTKKKIKTFQGPIGISLISSIKIVKLPPDLRTALENKAMRIVDQNREMRLVNKVKKSKAKKVSTNNSVRPNNNVKTNNKLSYDQPEVDITFGDRVHNKLQKAIANAFHKVLDGRIKVTPTSSDNKYSVISPYKISVSMDSKPQENSVSGVIFLYCAINILDRVEYYTVSSYTECPPDLKGLPEYDIKLEDKILNSLSPSPNRISKEALSDFNSVSWTTLVVTKDDMTALEECKTKENISGGLEFSKALPPQGALVGVAMDFKKSFNGEIKEQEVIDWIKDLCKQVIVSNPEIFSMSTYPGK